MLPCLLNSAETYKLYSLVWETDSWERKASDRVTWRKKVHDAVKTVLVSVSVNFSQLFTKYNDTESGRTKQKSKAREIVQLLSGSVRRNILKGGEKDNFFDNSMPSSMGSQ